MREVAARTEEIRVTPQGEGSCGLVVPIIDGCGERCVASCVCDLPHAEALARLAGEVLQRHDSVRRIFDLQEENESFAVQLSTDLEELSMLRSMVERMSATDGGGDELTTIARQALPAVNEVVNAESLAYVAVDDQDQNNLAGARVVLAIGPRPLARDLHVEATRLYGRIALKHTLIRNWENSDTPTDVEQESPLRGVRSLIVAPLATEERLFGWLVAANRTQGDTGIESSWQLASDEFGSGEGTLLATTASIMAMHASNREMLREKEQLLVNVLRSPRRAIGPR